MPPRSERRRTAAWLARTAVVLVALVGGVLVWGDRVRSRDEARDARVAALVAASQLTLADDPGGVEHAALLAVEALRREGSADAERALRGAAALLAAPAAGLALDVQPTAVALSPDGSLAVTAAAGDTPRLWEVATGREVAQLAHLGAEQVAFSADGRYLATTGNDRTEIWEPATGQGVGTISGGTIAAFGPSSRTILVAAGRTVQLYDLATARAVARFDHDLPVQAIAVSPDGASVATADRPPNGNATGTIRVWDTTSGRELARITPEHRAGAIVYSPDSRLIAASAAEDTAATGAGLVTVWDARSGIAVARLRHDGPVRALSFGGESGTLLTASDDGFVRQWSVADGGVRRRYAHGGAVTALRLTADGGRFATASADGAARLWDVATGGQRTRVAHTGAPATLALAADGTLLSTTAGAGRGPTGARGAVQFWRANSSPALTQLGAEPVASLAVSPDGRTIAAVLARTVGGAAGGTVVLWDVTGGREAMRLQAETPLRSLAFSPDSRTLAAAGEDRSAYVWDLATASERLRLAHDGPLLGVAFSPNGGFLATAGDSAVRLWEARSGRALAALPHDQPVRAFAFSPDGRHLATASGDQRVTGGHLATIWRIPDADPVLRLPLPALPAGIAYAADGRVLLVAAGESALVFDAETGDSRARLTHNGAVEHVLLAPDSATLLAVSGADAHLWQWPALSERATVRGRSPIRAAAFDPRGITLAIADGSGLRVVQSASGVEVSSLPVRTAAIAFSRNGAWLALGGDGGVSLLPWSDADLIAQTCARLTRNLTRAEWREVLGTTAHRRTCPDLPPGE